MSKYVITLVLCVIFQYLAVAQEVYYVVQVKGEVINQATKTAVKQGDKVSADDKLKFRTADAAVVFISSKRGRFIAKAHTTGNTNDSELVALVKNVLLPVKTTSNLSTRGSDENDGVVDLKNHLGTQKFYIIGNKLEISLNASVYPLSGDKFFIYRYEHAGKAISKKIHSEGQKIVLDKQILYETPHGNVSPESIEHVDVYYFDASTKKSTHIVKFSPVFLPEDAIADELKVQAQVLSALKLTHTEIKKELADYIADIYGKTDAKNVEHIMAKIHF